MFEHNQPQDKDPDPVDIASDLCIISSIHKISINLELLPDSDSFILLTNGLTD